MAREIYLHQAFLTIFAGKIVICLCLCLPGSCLHVSFAQCLAWYQLSQCCTADYWWHVCRYCVVDLSFAALQWHVCYPIECHDRRSKSFCSRCLFVRLWRSMFQRVLQAHFSSCHFGFNIAHQCIGTFDCCSDRKTLGHLSSRPHHWILFWQHHLHHCNSQQVIVKCSHAVLFTRTLACPLCSYFFSCSSHTKQRELYCWFAQPLQLGFFH